MTMRAARRCRTRRIPAISASRPAARVLIMDTGRAPPLAMSHEAHAGCLVVRILVAQLQPHRGQLRPAGDQPREAGGMSRARPPRIRPSRSTTRRRAAFSRRGFAQAPARRLPIVAGPHDVPVAREERDDAITLRAVARRLRGPLRRCASAHDCACAPTAGASTARTCSSPPMASAAAGTARDDFAVRFHLHPSSRRAALTDGHGVMLVLPNKEVWTFGLRGARRARGKRLSRRPRRPAPHGADRDLRPGPRGAARALDLSRTGRRGTAGATARRVREEPEFRCELPL